MNKPILLFFYLIILIVYSTIIKIAYSYEKSSGASALIIRNFNKIKNNLSQSIKDELIFRNKKNKTLKKIFDKYSSPLKNSIETFISACLKYELDCYLLPAIAGVESTFGKNILSGSYNPFGWGGGKIHFSNWDEAINIVSKSLKENYIEKGYDNLDEIGNIYAPNSDDWPKKVDFFLKEFYNEELKLNNFDHFIYD